MIEPTARQAARVRAFVAAVRALEADLGRPPSPDEVLGAVVVPVEIEGDALAARAEALREGRPDV